MTDEKRCEATIEVNGVRARCDYIDNMCRGEHEADLDDGHGVYFTIVWHPEVPQ